MLDLSLIYSQQENQGDQDSSTTNNDQAADEQADEGADGTGQELPTDIDTNIKLDKMWNYKDWFVYNSDYYLLQICLNIEIRQYYILFLSSINFKN